MDKNAIKKYAIWARRELISRVSQHAAVYGITDKGFGDASADSVHGRVLSYEERTQRKALIDHIQVKGYEQVMEEVAYTWFNRFIALRFMEVNGYLPSHVRVFTDEENHFKPQILAEAINVELDGLDMEKVYALKTANDDDTLFKYLIIVQCNALSSILPGMFQRIADYTELLFPDNLLREGSVIEQMVTMIPEEDWTDQVQIIGWLYQYYNTEPKDKVFADLKKNIKISKENIPAATQLFTPDWIVRYIVENSLGRLWLEGHPNNTLRAGWKYYIDEAEQEPDVQKQLEEIHKEYAALKPDEIKVIDPCCGSGHILAYMFDILMQIYETYGYSAREAVAGIVGNNLWGLDIDDRAAQLAYFSVMMKARQYDRRFFSRAIQPHVYEIVESNGIDPHCVEYYVDSRPELKSAMETLIQELYDAKEYGSILNVTPVDFETLYARFGEIKNEEIPGLYSYQSVETLMPLVRVAQTMAQKYDIVSTNPPYMGGNGMSQPLSNYIKKNYSEWKTDIYACFVDKGLRWLKEHRFLGYMTSYTWMFLNSFSKMRESLFKRSCIETLVQPEFHSFFSEAYVSICAFILRNTPLDYCGQFIRLEEFTGAENQMIKTLEAISDPNCTYLYRKQNFEFRKIPDYAIAYWMNNNVFDSFTKDNIFKVAEPRQGLATSDNNRFLRLWFEVERSNIGIGFANAETACDSGLKWFPYCKGGSFRKWSGNFDYIINWQHNGKELKEFPGSVIRNPSYYYASGLSWSSLTVGAVSFRYTPNGFLFDSKGPMCFAKHKEDEFYILALLNSKVTMMYLSVLAPTMDYSQGPIGKIPYIFSESQSATIGRLTQNCVAISKAEWDAYETSWDFEIHPLIPINICVPDNTYLISKCYDDWVLQCEDRFTSIKANEEELNRIFIDIYGLENELTSDVEEKDVSVRKANLLREIKSLISYAVGCMFGRYSLDERGLAYAGGEWDASKYLTFIPDIDAIFPICDDEYFEDDIVGRFVNFVETVYGKDTLEENLRFIADALGGKGSSREVIRNYFINDFYADHLKIYQKRPIYWLFDSGKKNGFKCLVYMHRYQPDTIARIRTDYVHEQQSRYRTAITDLEHRMTDASTAERVKLSKQLSKIKDQAEELRSYEEKIHHLADQMIHIDLDDGVKHNYAIFQDVLAKIK